jgi:hypothetical protein
LVNKDMIQSLQECGGQEPANAAVVKAQDALRHICSVCSNQRQGEASRESAQPDWKDPGFSLRERELASLFNVWRVASGKGREEPDKA